MKNSAPDLVLGPNIRLEENQLVPQQPGDIVQSHGEEHVLVDCDPGALEGGEGEEDEKGHNKRSEGQ